MSNFRERLVSSQIKPGEEGVCLVDYLSGRFTYLTRTGWLEAIESEICQLNGEVVEPNRILEVNDRISLDASQFPEPAVDSFFEIVYEDDDILVVNKSGDLPVHPSGAFYRHTLWYMLRENYESLHIINRLDRETSGLVLLAKNSKAAGKLGRQWEKRTVEKDYQVLVEGDFPSVGLKADGWLVKDSDSSIRKKQKLIQDNLGQGTSCSATFTLSEKRASMSLVNCSLKTGRMHQIRVSLYSLGFPVVGDKIYGIDDNLFLRFIEKKMTREDWVRLRLKRQALHCRRMAFRHPNTKEYVAFEAELPLDISEVLAGDKFDLP